MGASSARGPGGRDEDPVRRPGEPDGEASAWEPVMTRPDPMSAEEWRSQLECEPAEGSDPEEYPDEEDYLNPDALDLTDAELAEIAAATRLAALAAGQAYGTEGAAPGADPAGADPAGVADALLAQAAAASALRRGPRQPGSARLLAGEYSSRAAAFGTGMCLDVMPACPDLVLLADRAAGPDDSYRGASDDELIGVLCAWDRSESHAHARKLAAIAELRRRRPVPDPPTSGREAGSAGEDYLADEIAHALGESRRAADGLAAVAEALDGKLPRTRAGLLDGTISPAKARITAIATAPLDDDEAAAVEDKVLDRAGRITPGSLREAINRAVMEIAPDKARNRRETAARDTRVEQWAEDSGNAALAGRELPPADAIAAGQRISWWARQLRTAGVEGDLDQLRGRAFIDLLLSRDSRPAAGGQGGAGHDSTPAGPGQPGTAPFPGPGLIPAGSGGFAANVNLTVPLTTTRGLADRPGDLSGFGPVDPWLARDLVRAAAQNPKTTWCVTFTDQQGHATGHGCARPVSESHSKHGNHGTGGKRDGPGSPPSRTGIRDGPRFSFNPAGRDRPPGSYGTWILQVPGRELLVTIDPLTTENCDHRMESRGHDPGVKLRHLAQIRHATCTSPVCRRPAATCDFEHNIPYEAGGRTCLCNAGPKCRHDHRVKQHPRWNVDQNPDGTFTWTTPSGRRYATEPTQYPI
jgi:Domain of unknown function (DUF222)